MNISKAQIGVFEESFSQSFLALLLIYRIEKKETPFKKFVNVSYCFQMKLLP